MSKFLGELMRGLRCALEPAHNAFSNEQRFRQAFTDLGWDVTIDPATLALIRGALGIDSLFESARLIADQLEAGTGNTASLAVSLKEAITQIVNSVRQLGNAPPAGLPFPFNDPTFQSEIPALLADTLLLRFLQNQQPVLYGALRLLGLVEVTRETPTGAGRLPYKKFAIRWDRLPLLISNPVDLFRQTYQWNATGQPFAFAKLIETLEDFFRAIRVPARRQPTSETLIERYYDPANPALPQVEQLAIPIVMTAAPDWSSFAELGLGILPIPPKGQPTQPPVGFVITPLASAGISNSSAPNSPYSLSIKGGFQSDTAFGAEIRPGGVELFSDLGSAQITAELAFTARPPKPWIILGDDASSRLEVGGFAAAIGVTGQVASPEVVVRIGTGTDPTPPRIALVIQMSEGDGFLGKVVGSNPIRLEFGGSFYWSSRTGFHFEGSAGFEIAIPLHLNLGLAEIDTLQLAVRGSDGIAFEAGVNAKALLGPLTAVVENFGLKAKLKFAGTDGRLGPIGFDLGFKPPKGIGLSVDAGVVKGGGYLFLDPEKQEYAGALELVFSGFLTLKAIGLVTTKMPDGTKGFSLLIIITAEFGTGIQLGFGFTLLAVGGLIGLNRTIRLDVLTEGVRTGAVNSVMFPKDVIANAPKIISDLRAIFPPQEGRFLIGPMAKLGWGTPTLVSLSLGVIIEIPPGNVALVGVLKIALPAEEFAVVVLQVNFIGAFEPEKKRIYFFAGLFDSRVLFITLTGELGVLLAFGDDANFVLTVGGFHPRFTPPPLPFPTPQRLAINIINESFARIRVEGYFAVTTNSVQFGVLAEALFGFDDFNVSGHLQFDALFQFSPFMFDVSGSASLSIKVFGMGLWGIRVRFQLQGPTPWRVRGSGGISFLFFDIDVDFDFTWGESQDTSLPPVAAVPILAGELGKAECWRAELPAGSNLLVALRPLAADEAGKVLHPVGTLRVSQKRVPLDLTISKVGNQKVTDANRLRLDVPPGAPLKKKEQGGDVFEQFAPGQFRDLDDAAKLSNPAFTPEHGGIELTGTGGLYTTKSLVKRSTRFELILIDSQYLENREKFYRLHTALFAHWIRGASVSLSALSQARKKEMAPFADRIRVKTELFAVAQMENNKLLNAQAAEFTSESQAQDYLRNYVRAHPSQAGQLHIIPQFEVVS
jgi:hypothetical protein